MPRITLGPVDTYYEEAGSGDPLVLLHPGGADVRAFQGTIPVLAEHFHVFAPDRRGHGRTPDVEGPLHYATMADDTIAFLEAVVGGPAHLVGHSDGMPVALLTALARPDLVRGLVLASGVFHHSGWAPGVIDLDEETIAFFTAWHGEVAPDGPDHFPTLYAKLHTMQSEEPTLTTEEIARHAGRTLVMIGDEDDEVPIDHTIALWRALPRGSLAIVPRAGHGLPVSRPDLFHALVVDFLTVPDDEEDET
jgi:pimeloyl-ACP methyl ester carboxylesterase